MATGIRPDVTVVGAGIFGLACAWACLARGARVRVIERERPGAGASGGHVGALAPHVPEAWNAKKAFQLRSLLAAEDFWADVAAAGGIDPGYARSGRIQPLGDAAAVARAEARAAGAAALWEGRAVWRVLPAAAFGSLAPHAPTGLVIHDTLTARLNPRRAIAALVAAVTARGGEIRCPATPEDAAGAVVWATGADGLAELSAALGRPGDRAIGSAVKGQSALLAHDARDAPQVFADGIHIVPHADGTTAIGSTSERDFEDPAVTDAALETLIARARALCPALAGAPVLDRWAGLRPRARSRAPMLGPWPGRPGHFVANGGFKIGFGMAPEAASAMADLVLDGHDRLPEGFGVLDSL